MPRGVRAPRPQRRRASEREQARWPTTKTDSEIRVASDSPTTEPGSSTRHRCLLAANPVHPVSACWLPRDRPPAFAGAIVPSPAREAKDPALKISPASSPPSPPYPGYFSLCSPSMPHPVQILDSHALPIRISGLATKPPGDLVLARIPHRWSTKPAAIAREPKQKARKV